MKSTQSQDYASVKEKRDRVEREEEEEKKQTAETEMTLQK